MASKKKFEIARNPDGGWDVIPLDRRGPNATYPTKREALRNARALAKQNVKGELRIETEQGRIREVHSKKRERRVG